MRTYNNVIQLFNNIADAHEQVHSFGAGEVWQIDTAIEPSLMPKLWVVPGELSVSDNIMTYNLTVLCFDLVQKDESNLQEVLSDTQLILLDVVKVLREFQNEWFLLEGDPRLNPFTERFGEDVSGWRMDLQLNVDFANNECDMPMTDFVIPGHESQGGGGIPSGCCEGTPNEVLYYGADGLVTSDQYFSRTGQGNFSLGAKDGTDPELRFRSDGRTIGWEVEGGAGFELPKTQGTAGQVLVEDGTGALYWADQTGGGACCEGTPNEVLYYGADGLVTSDALFTRDANTAFTLAADDGTNPQLGFQSDGANIGWQVEGLSDFNLPTVHGTSGQVLTEDGTGDLYWSSIPAAPVTSVNGEVGDVVLDAGDIAETVNLHWLTSALMSAYDGAVAWITTNGSSLLSHLTNTSNPHSTTASQVGLGNVANIDMRPATLSVTIDGRGGVISTGQKGGFVTVPYNCTVTGWTILSSDGATGAATVGSIVVDAWDDTYANFPPTAADSIFVTKPSLSSQSKNSATGLSITLTAGTNIGFKVDSCALCQVVNLTLNLTKV